MVEKHLALRTKSVKSSAGLVLMCVNTSCVEEKSIVLHIYGKYDSMYVVMAE